MIKLATAFLLILSMAAAGQPQPQPVKTEAESYVLTTGTTRYPCTDQGGGEYVRYPANAYTEYRTYLYGMKYEIQFRVSSLYSGSKLYFYADTAVIKVIDIPRTGSNNVWTTVTDTIWTVEMGNRKLAVRGVGNTFNLNWIRYVPWPELWYNGMIKVPNKDSVLLTKIFTDGTIDRRMVHKDSVSLQ